MAETARQSLQEDIQEWRVLMSTTQRPSVIQVIKDKILSLEREVETLSGNRPIRTTNPSGSLELFASITNFTWDQTTEAIKLYITIDAVRELPEDKVFVTFEKQSLDVKIRGVSGCPNYQLLIKKLNKPIRPDQCKYKVKKNIISITLKKADLQWWTDVKHQEQKMPKVDAMADTDAKDPGASMLKLMKQLYDEGDDDMKKTIAKAWTESHNQDKFGGEMK